MASFPPPYTSPAVPFVFTVTLEVIVLPPILFPPYTVSVIPPLIFTLVVGTVPLVLEPPNTVPILPPFILIIDVTTFAEYPPPKTFGILSELLFTVTLLFCVSILFPPPYTADVIVPELIVIFDVVFKPPSLLPPKIVPKVPESIIISLFGTSPDWLEPPYTFSACPPCPYICGSVTPAWLPPPYTFGILFPDFIKYISAF